jgi:hypothetical protein
MPHSRGSCSCGKSLGRHAFVTRDGRGLQCGRCFAPHYGHDHSDAGTRQSQIERLALHIEKERTQWQQ